MTEHSDATLNERQLHRMLFFSDAVFAIVLTLLVLELRPPVEGDSAARMQALVALGPSLLAFLMSFGLIAIFWIAHMSTTRRLVQFDWATAIVNIAFLLPICLIPFASAWFGRSPNMGLAWEVYSGVLIATSAANVALVLVSIRGAGRLMAGPVGGRETLYRVGRAASPGIAFTLGLSALAMGWPSISQYCWVLIPFLLVGMNLVVKPRRAAKA